MSLLDKTIRGIAWTTVSKVFAQIIGFVIQVVLARLLLPDDFGLMAMILVITNFVTLFGELGFGAALIQRKEIDERHRSSVFWLNVVMGVILGAVTAASAPLIAGFYEKPILETMTLVVSINFLLAPLNMVQRALLNREMEFKALAMVDAARVFVAGGVAVAMAMSGYGVWSLVAQSLVATTIAAAVLWTLSPWRPRLLFDLAAIRELFSFSSNLLGFNVVNYWARQVDDILIGKVIGASALGLYNKAYATMMMPLNEVTQVLSTVMFPALSKIQGDPQRVKAIYLRSISMIALITFPLMSCLLVVSESFVLAVYGEHWRGMIEVLQIYSIVGLYQSIGTTVGWIYKSQGRTDWMFRWGLIASMMIIASIVFGVWVFQTIEGVAVSYAIMTGGILLYPQFAIPGRLIGMKVSEVVRTVLGPLACSALMAGAIWGLEIVIRGAVEIESWQMLVTQIAAALPLYLGLLWLGKVEAFLELQKFIGRKLAEKQADNRTHESDSR